MNTKIVFQNEHFVIVDKAPNILSVPSRLGIADPRPCLGRILEIELNKRIFPIHRLDFEVQGLIIYALTVDAQKAGNEWFLNKSILKMYSALTRSSQSFQVGESYEWKAKLLRGKKRAYESPHGKDSITHALLISTDKEGVSHWELSPVTGRSHQLRYELFRHKEVIIGDSLYGSTDSFHQEGIALRSYKIDFSNVINRDKFSLPENICTNKI